MKKIHLFAAAAALLISGGVFMKAYNAQKLGLPTNDLLLENLTAFSDPSSVRSNLIVTGRKDDSDSGTCGIVGFKEEKGPNQGYTYKDPICNKSFKAIYEKEGEWKRDGWSINYCCDSCKDTWYCGNK